MTSKAESHEELAEAERRKSDLAKWAEGLIPVPAAMIGRGSLYETVWLTRPEAQRLADAVQTLVLLRHPLGCPNIMASMPNRAGDL